MSSWYEERSPAMFSLFFFFFGLRHPRDFKSTTISPEGGAYTTVRRVYRILVQKSLPYSKSFSINGVTENVADVRAGSNDRRDFTSSELCAMVLEI